MPLPAFVNRGTMQNSATIEHEALCQPLGLSVDSRQAISITAGDSRKLQWLKSSIKVIALSML